MASAVVVFSGGQDSTTCLFWARARFERVSALNFFYGQRHDAECRAAQAICASINVPLVEADLRVFGQLSSSALTRDSIEVAATGGLHNLPSTFTPGRNLVFLTLAASYALSQDCSNLVTGVCETDYSGYPDCRRETVDAVEQAVRLGNAVSSFTIHTPLMFLSKKATVELATTLPGCLEALALSVTCYHGKRPGCGTCPACALRAKGFEEAGVPDPARG